jgi:hypothetical protein
MKSWQYDLIILLTAIFLALLTFALASKLNLLHEDDNADKYFIIDGDD